MTKHILAQSLLTLGLAAATAAFIPSAFAQTAPASAAASAASSAPMAKASSAKPMPSSASVKPKGLTQAEGLALASSKNCLACHAIDHAKVGPAYEDVAAKYAGKPGAVAKLTTAIEQGVSGVWGPIPMPAEPQVTPAQAKELATWVLQQKH